MPKQQTQPKQRKAASVPSDGWEDAKLQAELDAMILENAAITAAKEAEQKAAAPPSPPPSPSPPAAPAVKVRRCCQKCQGDNPTLMCPLCKTYYCSAACQAAHWPLHKEQCGKMAGQLDDAAGVCISNEISCVLSQIRDSFNRHASQKTQRLPTHYSQSLFTFFFSR